MGFHGGADGGLAGAGEELGGLSEGGAGQEVISGRHGLRPETDEARLKTGLQFRGIEMTMFVFPVSLEM